MLQYQQRYKHVHLHVLYVELAQFQASWRDVTGGSVSLLQGHSHVTLTDLDKVVYSPPLQLVRVGATCTRTRTCRGVMPSYMYICFRSYCNWSLILPMDGCVLLQKQLEQPPVQFLSAAAAHAPPLDVTSAARGAGGGSGDALTSQMVRYTLLYADHVRHDFNSSRCVETRVCIYCTVLVFYLTPPVRRLLGCVDVLYRVLCRLCRVPVRVQCRNVSAIDLRLEVDTGQTNR